MKTKKLSEISVNASTLNSELPSFYDQGIHGLGVHLREPKNLPVHDLNDSTMKTGFYWTLSTTTGKPSGFASGFLIHISARATLQNQILLEFTSGRMFVRAQMDNVWSNWKLITMV